MNKQEAIERIEELKKYSCGALGDSWISLGIDKALNVVKQLDEPEKPVVPRCVADMIVKRKKQGDSLVATLVNLGAFGDAQRWIRKGDNGDTFAKAWLFGYELEKEKLYTVKFATEEFGKIYIGIFRKHNKLGISTLPLNDDDVKAWFTEDELKRFKFWDNPAFEIEEVKE